MIVMWLTMMPAQVTDHRPLTDGLSVSNYMVGLDFLPSPRVFTVSWIHIWLCILARLFCTPPSSPTSSARTTVFKLFIVQGFYSIASVHSWPCMCASYVDYFFFRALLEMSWLWRLTIQRRKSCWTQIWAQRQNTLWCPLDYSTMHQSPCLLLH